MNLYGVLFDSVFFLLSRLIVRWLINQWLKLLYFIFTFLKRFHNITKFHEIFFLPFQKWKSVCKCFKVELTKVFFLEIRLILIFFRKIIELEEINSCLALSSYNLFLKKGFTWMIWLIHKFTNLPYVLFMTCE